MRRHTSSSKRAEKAKQCWGASLSKVDDVGKVFVKYAKGEDPALTSTTVETSRRLKCDSSTCQPVTAARPVILQTFGCWFKLSEQKLGRLVNSMFCTIYLSFEP